VMALAQIFLLTVPGKLTPCAQYPPSFPNKDGDPGRWRQLRTHRPRVQQKSEIARRSEVHDLVRSVRRCGPAPALRLGRDSPLLARESTVRTLRICRTGELVTGTVSRGRGGSCRRQPLQLEVGMHSRLAGRHGSSSLRTPNRLGIPASVRPFER
jgi:hypothetical protein